MGGLRAALALLALLISLPSQALEVSTVTRGRAEFTVVRVDPARDRLKLFLAADWGAPFDPFAALSSALESKGGKLLFAMNAGMYEPDFSPVGLFVADGVQKAPLNLRAGVGNFYLKPNGVFYLGSDGAGVVDAAAYARLDKKVLLATQSGPMLVLDGAMHAAFLPDSASRLIRNGVGVSESGAVVFAISETPVNFYEFASLFRDALHCPNALYLDGSISGMVVAGGKRSGARSRLGPIIAVVQ